MSLAAAGVTSDGPRPVRAKKRLPLVRSPHILPLMRALPVLLVLPTLACAAARTSAPPVATAEREILDLERAWGDAEVRRDAAALDAILDDRFVFTYGAEAPVEKATIWNGDNLHLPAGRGPRRLLEHQPLPPERRHERHARDGRGAGRRSGRLDVRAEPMMRAGRPPRRPRVPTGDSQPGDDKLQRPSASRRRRRLRRVVRCKDTQAIIVFDPTQVTP